MEADGIRWILVDSIGFHWILLDSIEFYWIPLDSVGFYRIPRFRAFRLALIRRKYSFIISTTYQTSFVALSQNLISVVISVQYFTTRKLRYNHEYTEYFINFEASQKLVSMQTERISNRM